jgi:hypothetical protein
MTRLFRSAVCLALGVLSAGDLGAQLPDYPLSPLRPRGDLVAPFFDGFYRNADGSFTLSFGFLNRNTDEDVYIPLGPNNFIEPAEFDGVQPTFFPHYSRGGFVGRRERGAFAITVPAEFAGRDVVWTLTHAGQTWSVPGRVTRPGYELSYLPAAAGSLPPSVRFEDGPESTGREGVYAERETVRAGEGLAISLWVQDRGERVDGRVPVNVTWQRHQGPGAVEFQPATQRTDQEGWGEATTVAVFREAGEYVLRARVDNFGSSDSRFDNQCCWSNAYVPVTVTP